MRVLLLFCLVLAACDTATVFPPEDPITAAGLSLVADDTAYERGERVTLTLRNDGAVAVDTGVMGCAQLERRTAEGWSSDLAYNDRGCVYIAVRIEPSTAFSGEVELDDVRAGTYRFTHGASGVAVSTASFVVR